MPLLNHTSLCKHILPVVLWLFVIVACSGGDGDRHDPADLAEGKIRVGFARVDVTPEVPVKLAGYGTFFFSEDECRWSTGIHDPLFASAVAFDDPDGAAPVILVVLDLVGLMVDDIATIQRGIADALGVGERSVVVASTHAHHGPDTIGLWGVIVPPISGRQEEVVQRILSGAVQAGIYAWNSRVPATLEYAVGEEADLHENIIFDDPHRTIDDTMTLLAAYDEERRLLGTLMNWACHPTIMGQNSTLVSSDFAGAYYRIMGEELEGTHIYVNGTLGAMIQPVHRWLGPDAWDEVDRVGRGLADDARSLLTGATRVDDPGIRFLETRDVPVRMWNLQYVLAAALGLIDREMPPLGGYTSSPMTTFAIGPVTFGTLPGEFVPDYSAILRNIMGGDAQILIGLGMDWFGYALTPRQAMDEAYLYERSLCPGPGAGEALAAAYRDVYVRM